MWSDDGWFLLAENHMKGKMMSIVVHLLLLNFISIAVKVVGDITCSNSVLGVQKQPHHCYQTL